ncbi:MAG: winged helix-turn-helix transcriptional regulator [Candidatus Aenigmatarchaeota archaeon]|nr:MAG: winged helix-turn-helix transcriptional regulator [Candidatus Aenigmarchaeota archaeon]
MIEFLGSRKMEKEKLDSLSKAEKLRELEKEKSLNQRIESLIFKKFKETGLDERMKEMNFTLEEIAEKVEQLMFLYQSNSRQKTSPSVRKMRVKEMITLLLQQHGQLSAPQLCNLLNLSRTRCSEYLKEMENKGLLESELNCRKKFYKFRH